ncbi:hypothetical protein EJ06DRAFT_282273 [Trichodelitschia bisporula]|uniref:Uncharacterized protein n=1 Tax=Trichodelitschia bisporula TaxID=703511 RepID=A0A6G1I5H8_9PEZI|nr:hypothetical protein EJ06DRAFT_282273 [Trichodelitschia bisporula]
MTAWLPADLGCIFRDPASRGRWSDPHSSLEFPPAAARTHIRDLHHSWVTYGSQIFPSSSMPCLLRLLWLDGPPRKFAARCCTLHIAPSPTVHYGNFRAIQEHVTKPLFGSEQVPVLPIELQAAGAGSHQLLKCPASCEPTTFPEPGLHVLG